MDISRNWPQEVLLHDHGDGSITILPILADLYRHYAGKKFPLDENCDFYTLHKQVKEWFVNPQIDIVTRFSLTTGVLQNYDALAVFAEQYVKYRAGQGFKYCEMTMAPQYHVNSGLTTKSVVKALIHGIKQGERRHPKFEADIIFSIGREVEAQEAVRLVDIAGECDRNYVIGIGLVCDESSHPPEKHKAMFKRAKELGFKTTCHAGEWVSQEPDFQKDLPGLIKNIRTAVVDLEVDRIGHAIGLPYDSALMKIVADRGIGIEGCPGSNFASELIPDVNCLKIREMLDQNVLYSLNPDDDLFLPDLDETFQLCDAAYRFTEEEKCKLQANAWATRFGHRKYS